MQETQDTTPVDEPEVGPEPRERTDRRRIIGITLIAVILLAIIGATIFGLVSYPTLTSIFRDISIIVLALVTVVIGVFLIILIFQLQSLTVLLRDEIKPILDSANETANTVRGTTTFVSDAVVTPLIHVASLASGVAQTFRTLASTGHKQKRQTKTQPDTKQE